MFIETDRLSQNCSRYESIDGTVSVLLINKLSPNNWRIRGRRNLWELCGSNSNSISDSIKSLAFDVGYKAELSVVFGWKHHGSFDVLVRDSEVLMVLVENVETKVVYVLYKEPNGRLFKSVEKDFVYEFFGGRKAIKVVDDFASLTRLTLVDTHQKYKL